MFREGFQKKFKVYGNGPIRKKNVGIKQVVVEYPQ